MRNKYNLFTNLFIVLLLIKSAIFQFSSSISVLPIFSSENILMFLRNGLVLIILSALLNLIFYKKYRESLVLFNILLSIIIIGDAVYMRYYYTSLTISLIPLAKFAGSIGDSVSSLFSIWDFLYIIDIPIIIILMVKSLKSENTIFFKNKRTKRNTLFTLIIISVSLIFSIIITPSKTYTEIVSDNNYAVRKAGIIFFHFSDIKDSIVTSIKSKTPTKDEIDLVKTFLDDRASAKTNYFGLCENQNLIIIQMEAIENFLINSTIDGVEITPNLNKFVNDSIYFENFFHQVAGGNTSDAEFLVNNSLYPVKKGAVYFTNDKNKYMSAPNYLNKLGYSTYVLHPNNDYYWNRDVMYQNIGFNNYINAADFILDEKLGWGLTDSSFYRQSFNYIDTNNPFFAFYITLSSHHPFNFFAETEWFDPGLYANTMFGNYIKGANYADKAFGEFIEDLKKRGLYDNSLIIVYGDHSAIPRNQAYEKSILTDTIYDDFSWIHQQEIPLFIHSSKLEPEINSTYSGQIDILPTIANLMGFETKYALGKDILNTDFGYAIKRNKDIISDEFTYINITGLVYDHDGRLVEDGRYDEKIKELHNELYISDIILDKNIIAVFEE